MHPGPAVSFEEFPPLGTEARLDMSSPHSNVVALRERPKSPEPDVVPARPWAGLPTGTRHSAAKSWSKSAGTSGCERAELNEPA